MAYLYDKPSTQALQAEIRNLTDHQLIRRLRDRDGQTGMLLDEAADRLEARCGA